MSSLLARTAPGLFVLLWSTGFIGAKYGLPYAGSISFLLLRFIAVTVLLGLLAQVARVEWPEGWTLRGHIVMAGLLVHGGYLGGVFSAIDLGLSAGLTAVVVCLQPILTALLAGRVLGERTGVRRWLGLLLGLAGVAIVVAPGLAAPGSAPALGFAVLALLSITLGTLYQKRYCARFDMIAGAVWQYAACGILFGLLLAGLDEPPVVWHEDLLFALAWLVLVLSIGAIFLLYHLIREGQATRVASYFYLVPPTTALMAWLMFDEPLTVPMVAGIAVTAAGVALATRGGNGK